MFWQFGAISKLLSFPQLLWPVSMLTVICASSEVWEAARTLVKRPRKVSLPWSLYIFHSYFLREEKYHWLKNRKVKKQLSWPHLEAVEFKCQWCFDNKVLIFFRFNHNSYNFLKCDWCINSHILLKLICKVIIGQLW